MSTIVQSCHPKTLFHCIFTSAFSSCCFLLIMFSFLPKKFPQRPQGKIYTGNPQVSKACCKKPHDITLSDFLSSSNYKLGNGHLCIILAAFNIYQTFREKYLWLSWVKLFNTVEAAQCVHWLCYHWVNVISISKIWKTCLIFQQRDNQGVCV